MSKPSGATQLVYGQLGAASQVYVQSDAVKVDDAAGHVRVYLGNIPGGDYGLQVVSADGSTVIIDGTSDVFKISASGTLSDTATAGNGTSSSVDLSGLGTYTVTPAHLSFVGLTSTGADVDGFFLLTDSMVDLYGASVSGGSPTGRFVALKWIAETYASLDTGHLFMYLFVHNADSVSHTAYSRYYVLQESAL